MAANNFTDTRYNYARICEFKHSCTAVQAVQAIRFGHVTWRLPVVELVVPDSAILCTRSQVESHPDASKDSAALPSPS